jgi:hypothetical protein
MFMLTHRVRTHPEVVDTEMEGEGVVLLHLESQIYFSLNETGTMIWKAMKQGLTLQEICHRLQEEFQVGENQAEQSVLALTRDLAQHKLVQKEEP